MATSREPPQCRSALAVAVIAMLGSGLATSAAADQDASPDVSDTATPIKHLVVVVGENRSFDHIYATYVPQGGQTVLNLLSEGIVQADGSPGPNFAAARQFTTSGHKHYFIGVARSHKTPYDTLPPPTLGGAPNVQSATLPPFPTSFLPLLALLEPSLEPAALPLLTTGATGAAVTSGAPDTRIANYGALLNGPFQLTGPKLPYDSYTGDTVHRFYQMWQQSDCRIEKANEDNPSGCLSDLYPYVATTFAGPQADEGGATSMAFYNMQSGDAPLLKRLADQYTLSDNHHQPAQGGSSVQHIFLGTGDDIFSSDGNANPTVPPASQIADPNPLPGTNNQYRLNGRYSYCANLAAPGVFPIVRYLESLRFPVAINCAAGHYYMLNNTNPGFLPNGQIDAAGITNGTSIPPSNVRTIGDALNDKGISWTYYGGAYNAAVNLANGSTNPLDAVGQAYCASCNFAGYASSIMGDAGQRALHIKDITDFFAAVTSGSLPSVSFVKPDALVDGHPATSKLDLYEAMLQKVLDTLDGNPALKAETALFITFDEGGGYYDSGFIQPLDFFGDGPRTPLIAVSQYSKGGHVVHSYTDHVSILKFIERNWHLGRLTGRSRDNLPNPHPDSDNPYVPVNSPAIGDLFDMFDFGRGTDNEPHKGG
ncbi:MAG: phosphoesterase [Alphaproteobacteria bacterium]|nr:phosphoesterase [Alphaproteobacteria bacterium]